MESNGDKNSKRNHPTWFYVIIALVIIAIAAVF